MYLASQVGMDTNTRPDVFATADAARIINNLRIRHAGELPNVIWRIMVNAEQRLNAELERYFRHDTSLCRQTDTSVNGPSILGPETRSEAA
jgi:hypothetical protein